MTDLVTLQRLMLITLIAGAIGFERERHGRAAGFRTHILVGVGSCLVMLTGLYLMEVNLGRVSFDPTRMAAQVLSGIGFLGAGTILRSRASIRGLTTAASLWAVTGIGLAVGAGFLTGALATGGIVLIALFGLSGMERAMRKEQYHALVIETTGSGHDLAQIRGLLAECDIDIRGVDIRDTAQSDRVTLEFQVRLQADQSRDEIIQDILRLQHVVGAHWA